MTTAYKTTDQDLITTLTNHFNEEGTQPKSKSIKIKYEPLSKLGVTWLTVNGWLKDGLVENTKSFETSLEKFKASRARDLPKGLRQAPPAK